MLQGLPLVSGCGLRSCRILVNSNSALTGDLSSASGCVLSLQAREKVAEVETQRLQAVLQHPQFQANPLAAVASHLAATLPAAPPPPSSGPAKDAATLRREKKKRRKERARQAAAMGDD